MARHVAGFLVNYLFTGYASAATSALHNRSSRRNRLLPCRVPISTDRFGLPREDIDLFLGEDFSPFWPLISASFH